MGDRPITSGYRNDARRIDTGGVSIWATALTLLEQDSESALAAIPSGYGEGVYEGLWYGVTVLKAREGKRASLFARALAGGDVVSFNVYRLRSGDDSLRPAKCRPRR